MLTWNSYHGRAVPPAGQDLLGPFAAALAGWRWDVALLQEVPPWWPRPLARASGALGFARVLTSRNAGLALRREIAVRAPDLIKSNGGGSNAILVRPRAGRVIAHRAARVRCWPERRAVHAVRLQDGPWIANVHASVHRRAQEDLDRSLRQLEEWSAGAPAVLGGDFNVARPELPGFERLAAARIDHIWGRGVERTGRGEVLDAGALSDHPPVVVDVRA